MDALENSKHGRSCTCKETKMMGNFTISISLIQCRTCRYVMDTLENGNFYCSNKKCKDALKTFAVRVTVVEVPSEKEN